MIVGGNKALLSTGRRLNYTSNSTGVNGGNEQSYSCRIWVDFNVSQALLQYYEEGSVI